MTNHIESYRVARQAIDKCEENELPMILLTLNENGNLNVITNVPITAVESLCKVLDNAKQLIAQKAGN